MNTNEIRAAASSVTGARHRRAARNGQDAAACWVGDDVAAIVVCDGCSSGASSEVGARLGARLVLGALATRLAAGQAPAAPAMWQAVRAEVVAALDTLVARLAGDREQMIHDHFLFTIVAAAASRRTGQAAVWMLGDGAYAFGEQRASTPSHGIAGEVFLAEPSADNAPPYVGYDLLGQAHPARLAIAPARCRVVVVATDGASELPGGIAGMMGAELVAHPDALRRRLEVLARGRERIAWDERRVVRTPAALQDDCAVAVLHGGAP
jgi:hypothetical protein